MSEVERWAAQSALATEEMERQSGILRELERELERDTTSLSCSDYMSLQAQNALERLPDATALLRKLEGADTAIATAVIVADLQKKKEAVNV